MSTLKVNTINAATSGQAVAVDIKTPKSFRNLVINGQFQIWQRKTDSGAGQTSAAYISDRWQINASGSTYQCTRQAFTEGQTDVPSYPQYYHRLSVTTGANNAGPRQRIENVRSVQGEHTLSFWARGTNPAGGHVDSHTKQNFGSGGSSEIETILGPITLNADANTWTKYTFTFTPTSLAGKTIGDNSFFQITFKQPSDDNGTAAWSIDIANVQLEKGSVPSDYEQRSYGDELARCQRFCNVFPSSIQDGYGAVVTGYCVGSTLCQGALTFPDMRAAPTASVTGNFRTLHEGSATASSAIDGVNLSANSVLVRFYVSSGLTTGNAGLLTANNDTSAKYILSAEL